MVLMPKLSLTYQKTATGSLQATTKIRNPSSRGCRLNAEELQVTKSEQKQLEDAIDCKTYSNYRICEKSASQNQIYYITIK